MKINEIPWNKMIWNWGQQNQMKSNEVQWKMTVGKCCESKIKEHHICPPLVLHHQFQTIIPLELKNGHVNNFGLFLHRQLVKRHEQTFFYAGGWKRKFRSILNQFPAINCHRRCFFKRWAARNPFCFSCYFFVYFYEYEMYRKKNIYCSRRKNQVFGGPKLKFQHLRLAE